MKKIIYLICLSLFMYSCKDDDNPTGSLSLQFTNVVGTSALTLETENYTNTSNETYTVSELKYIISNITLIKASGEEFIYPIAQSYFVINEANANSKTVALSGITAGEYAQIKFGFGIDQSNYPLNGVNNFIPTAEETGMLWSWSAGYKFLKFEGNFTPDGGTQDDFILHVGSHGATLDNYKEVVLDLPSTMAVNESGNATINIKADIAKIFDSTNTHALATKSDIQVDPVNAPKIAENVRTMFSINN